MIARKKILAVPEGDIFLERDVEILKKHFEVRTAPTFNRKKPITTLPSIFKILKGTLWADVTFSWFADTHAFLAVLFSKIFRKKSIVVAGGYDVAAEPDIAYGVMKSTKSIPAMVVKFTLRYADRILALSDSSKNSVLRNAPKAKVETLYCGVDTKTFNVNNEKGEKLVISAGLVIKSNLKRKGMETFVRSAEYLPKVKFVLIGKHVDNSIHHLTSIAPSNVSFTGFVSDEQLVEWYQRAKVYVQVSAHEGFGLAMAEAMSCECVPVVTNRGAIPEVVGDAGFYVPYGDPKATAEAVKKALNADGKMARERIVKDFPLEKREAELIRIINQLI